MALLLLWGCDKVLTNKQVGGGVGVSGTPELSTDRLRLNGAKSIKFSTSAAAENIQLQKWAASGFFSSFTETTLFVTFWVNFDVVPGADLEICAYGNSNVSDFIAKVVVETDGDVVLLNEAATKSSVAGNVADDGNWHRIDVKFVESGTCTLQVDLGTAVTLTGSAATQTDLVFGCINTATTTWYLDDVVVSDSAFPGSYEICTLTPDAVGTFSVAWNATGTTGSGGYPELDETETDGDTSIIVAANTSNDLSMHLSALPSARQPLATQTMAYGRDNAGGFTSAIVVYAYDGTTKSATSGANMGTVYSVNAKLIETDPSGGALTIAGVNNQQAGVSHVAAATATPQISTLWVEVLTSLLSLASADVAPSALGSAALDAIAARTESVAASASPTVTAQFAVAQALSVAPSASASGALATSAEATANVAPSASPLVAVAFVSARSESVGATEASLAGVTFEVTAAESVGLTAAATATVNYAVGRSESVALAEAAEVAAGFLATAQADVAPSTAPSVLANISVTADEFVLALDSSFVLGGLDFDPGPEGCECEVLPGGGMGGAPSGSLPFGSTMPFGLGLGQAITLTANQVAVPFTGDPGLPNPLNPQSPLNARNWILRVLDPLTAVVRLAQQVALVSPVNYPVMVREVPQLVLTTVPAFLVTFDGPLTQGALYDLSLVESTVACSCAEFRGLFIRCDAIPSDGRDTNGFLVDVANPYLARDSYGLSPRLSTYQVTDTGDVGLDKSPQAGLRKRVARRVLSCVEDFVHLKDYGAQLTLKTLMRVDELRRIQARIEAQVKREPEVVSCRAIVSRIAGQSAISVACQVRTISDESIEVVVPVKIP